MLVEGPGDQEAVPVLIGRLLREEKKRFDWLAEKKHVMKVHGLERLRKELPVYMEHLRGKPACDGALILLDLEDALPCEEAPRLAADIAACELPFPVGVVFAYREYEAWFLAGLPSVAASTTLLADGLTYQGDPEARRGVKEWLSSQMPRGRKYEPTQHQALFTRSLDFRQARQAPSFRRLERALDELLHAVDTGIGTGLVSPLKRR